VLLIEGTLQRVLYTGFFLEHRGALHWITAAHCLEHWDELVANPAVTIEAARWLDRHTVDEARSIPVDLGMLRRKHLKSDFLDVGVVFPSSHEDRLFRANPDYHPLNEGVWQGRMTAQPEGLYVLGYPDEWRDDVQTETTEKYDLEFTAALASLPMVERLAPNSGTEPENFWGRKHCIYGRVALPEGSPGRTLTSIKGMSGGPVFSVEQTPEKRIKYRLFGVQSSWLPGSHVVRAEPIELVVELIDGTFDS